MENRTVVKFHGMRQIKDGFHASFQRKLHVTNDLVKRLGLETELEGHTGCVNCLQWNDKGDLLASGSDDLNIILWAPFCEKRLHTVESGHHGNIFSVKFVPGTNDHCVVSGAADFKIRVNNYISNENTFSCSCHGARVKRIATATNMPNMFWSAAEDGMVLQFDLRSPHTCSSVCKNVLVNLVNHLGKSAEAKCLAISPVNSDLVAVGANDPYVRLYDRRMIKPITARFSRDHPSSPWEVEPFSGVTPEPGEDNLSSSCVSYFVAGHLPMKYDDFKRRHRSMTYVTFSPDGKDLLANLGGEQIYLFNVMAKQERMVFNLSQQILHNMVMKKIDNNEVAEDSDECCLCDNGVEELQASKGNGINGLLDRVKHSVDCICNRNPATTEDVTKSSVQELPKKVNDMKICADKAFERKDYNLAISIYNTAIIMCSTSACLYANRAAAYIKRSWDGDYYAAIRDCHSALKLDPQYLKAHYRLLTCLHKLDWAKEAFDSLEAFLCIFPNYRKTKQFQALEKEIRDNMEHTCGYDSDTKLCEDGSSSSTASSSSFSSLLGMSNFLFSSRRSKISEQEKEWRTDSSDYEYRYCGHCNTTTDIKEANFFGSSGEFVVAGSDDGSIFIWDRASTNIARVLRGDDSIVNCLQPHPSTCMLATSGIDPVVRLWSPRAENGEPPRVPTRRRSTPYVPRLIDRYCCRKCYFTF